MFSHSFPSPERLFHISAGHLSRWIRIELKHTVKASLLFLVTSTRWLLTSGSSSSGNLALMESTCSAGDTDWNSGSNASENLRLWIQSVRIGSGGGGGGEGGFAVSFYDDEEQNRDEPQ